MAKRSVLTDADVLAYTRAFDGAADPIRARMDWMVEAGLLEVHPDDLDKPWAERRLLRTAKGEAFRGEMEAGSGE